MAKKKKTEKNKSKYNGARLHAIYSGQLVLAMFVPRSLPKLLKLTKQRTTSHSFWWHEIRESAGRPSAGETHASIHKNFRKYLLCAPKLFQFK